MKQEGKKSWKEEEFNYFLNRKRLKRPGVKMTVQLETIIHWVTLRGGRPVKAIFKSKKSANPIELVDIAFFGNTDDFFKEVSWEAWYEVFTKNQLRFFYQDNLDNGPESSFYKITK